MKFVLFIFSTFLFSCSYLHESQNILREGEYAIPLEAAHFVSCMTAVRSSCGISLSDCSDSLRYDCTTNVVIFDPTLFMNVRGVSQ